MNWLEHFFDIWIKLAIPFAAIAIVLFLSLFVGHERTLEIINSIRGAQPTVGEGPTPPPRKGDNRVVQTPKPQGTTTTIGGEASDGRSSGQPGQEQAKTPAPQQVKDKASEGTSTGESGQGPVVAPPQPLLYRTHKVKIDDANLVLPLRPGPDPRIATDTRIPPRTDGLVWKGKRKYVRKTDSDWIKVEYNGEVGWVNEDYVEVQPVEPQ